MSAGLPSRVVPERVEVKVHTLVPWQYPLTVPVKLVPLFVYASKAAFKFNVGEKDEALSPSPHPANKTVGIRNTKSIFLFTELTKSF